MPRHIGLDLANRKQDTVGHPWPPERLGCVEQQHSLWRSFCIPHHLHRERQHRLNPKPSWSLRL